MADETAIVFVDGVMPIGSAEILAAQGRAEDAANRADNDADRAEAAAEAAASQIIADQRVPTDADRIALTGLAAGATVYVIDTGHTWQWSGSAWVDLGQGPLADLASAAGNPMIGPSATWVTLDQDQTGRPVRAMDFDGRDWRAWHGHFLAEADPTLIVDDMARRAEIDVDQDLRPVRLIDSAGIVHEARRGRLLPVGNDGALRSIVAYGDSTTYGDELTDRDADRWTTLLSTALGIPVTNRGANGQQSNGIVARMGARLPRATVTGGTIPASGSVSLTSISDDLWPTRGPVVLITDAGNRIRGRMTRVASDAATFARYEPGVAVTATAVDIWVEQGWCDLAAHTLLGMGINDKPQVVNGTLTIADMQARYRAATSACRGGFTVWGILDRGEIEAPGTIFGDFIRAMEAWFAVEYGRDFCPVRQYLASQRALDDAARLDPSFEPTPEDIAAVASGVEPPSFRFAGVHLNPLGHQLQALCLERHLRIRFNLEQ